MATLMYCPKCQQPQECIKKGKKKTGEQLWGCKVCSGRFVATTDLQKTAPKKPAVPKKTKIYVNSNMVKEVDGIISQKEASELVTGYFKEISNATSKVNDVSDDLREIKFSVKVGSKS
jgi:hypothetical protein